MLFTLVFLSVYSYLLYPLIMAGFSRIFRRAVMGKEAAPRVTLIVSVFNEEAVITEKLRNCLGLDYPRELLEILVVSDASTDRTEAIVREFESSGVSLLARPTRQGKTAGLNDAVARARGEVIVFSDADSLYPADAMRKMTAVLSAPGVGLVTGSTDYIGSGEAGVAKTSGIYTRMERWTKRFESEIGSCVGADGAMFAMWKSLFRTLREDDINDFVIPLMVVRQGFRVVFREDLRCVEQASEDASTEFRRQIRITNRTIRALFRNADLMNPFRYPSFSFELVSHKLLRLTVPIFMVLLLIVNTVLLGEGNWHLGLFACQAAFYGAAFLAFLLDRWHLKSGKLGITYHFVAVNAAILLGWIAFFRGQRHVTWGNKGIPAS
jgi:cellulose synthase/poly-beta-1,6-N-acetylglucosamine synthase-like glycosyltransferase